jgi:hypothetical protein
VAAALVALRDHRVDAPFGHLLGVPGRADRRHREDAGGFERLHEDPSAADPAKLASLTPERTMRSIRWPTSGLVGAHVHAEGPVGPALHLLDRALELIERHRGRREDAHAAGGARCGREARAGHPAHAVCTIG